MPTADPKVSVIMPVYNAARFLREALDSVVSQTLQEIEIILVDDGSTDESRQIMKQIQAADDRVRIIEQANAGAGVARNAGLEIARGEYLSFLDADDVFDHDMLAASSKRASHLAADVIIFRCIDFSNKTGRQTINHNCNPSDFPKRQPFRFEDIAGNPFHIMGFTWDKLFRREFVLECGFEFQALPNANDALFTYSAMLTAARIAFLNRFLVRRRLDTGQNISHNFEHSWKAEWDYESALKAFLESEGLWPRYAEHFLNAYAGHWVHRFARLATPEVASDMFDFTLTHWLKEFPVLELEPNKIQPLHNRAVATLQRIAEYHPGEYEAFAAKQQQDPVDSLTSRLVAIASRGWRRAWTIRIWCSDRWRSLRSRGSCR